VKKCASSFGIMLVASLALIGGAALSEERAVPFVDVHAHNLTPIGFRLSVCVSHGEAPYNYICQSRANNDIHAYKSGRYRDRGPLASPGEWRGPFVPGWSVAVLDGKSGNAAKSTKFKFDDLLPAAGGMRFKTTKRDTLNYTVDVTGGRKGFAVYFRIGEAY